MEDRPEIIILNPQQESIGSKEDVIIQFRVPASLYPVVLSILKQILKLTKIKTEYLSKDSLIKSILNKLKLFNTSIFQTLYNQINQNLQDKSSPDERDEQQFAKTIQKMIKNDVNAGILTQNQDLTNELETLIMELGLIGKQYIENQLKVKGNLLIRFEDILANETPLSKFLIKLLFGLYVVKLFHQRGKLDNFKISITDEEIESIFKWIRTI
jgi:hypothetical protein